MIHSLDAAKLLDRLSSDLRVSLQILDLSKSITISSMFAHVKVRIFGQYQKIWEISCLRQLSTMGFTTFDESNGEITLISDGLSDLIKNSDNIKKIVIEACDSVPNNPTWDKITWNEIKSQSLKVEKELPVATFVDLTSSYDSSMILESDKNTNLESSKIQDTQNSPIVLEESSGSKKHWINFLLKKNGQGMISSQSRAQLMYLNKEVFLRLPFKMVLSKKKVM